MTVEILFYLIESDAVSKVGQDYCHIVDKSYWHLEDAESCDLSDQSRVQHL